MVDTVIVENEQPQASGISWAAVLAGAAVTLAISLMLLALGSGIGFSVIDPWAPQPTRAETTRAITVAGIYLTATAVIASALGGYIAGRLRRLFVRALPDEVFFRDTAHGFVTWAVATALGAAFLASAGATLTGSIAGGAAAAATQKDTLLADRLFGYDYALAAKTTGNAPNAAINRTFDADRDAAGRLLGRAVIPGRSLTTADRQLLIGMVGARTGMSQADAEQRVAAVEADARAAADTARRVSMMLAFWTVAAMLAGALASCLAAWEGGTIRDRHAAGR
jgi:hypothetical protein